MFDPPMVAAGATLGGAIATGLNGPGAFGHGRARDAILGVTLIDGRGEIHHLGGQVVKNVAGFDIPKLLVGSLGSFGLLAEISIKVCPLSPTAATFEIATKGPEDFTATLQHLTGLSNRPVAIEGQPKANKVWVRFEAPADALPELAKPLTAFDATELNETDAKLIWDQMETFAWAASGDSLLKTPTNLPQLPQILSHLVDRETSSLCHVGLGGDVVYWTEAPDSTTDQRHQLASQGFASLQIRGTGPALILATPVAEVCHRIKTVFDPEGKFPALPEAVIS